MKGLVRPTCTLGRAPGPLHSPPGGGKHYPHPRLTLALGPPGEAAASFLPTRLCLRPASCLWHLAFLSFLRPGGANPGMCSLSSCPAVIDSATRRAPSGEASACLAPAMGPLASFSPLSQAHDDDTKLPDSGPEEAEGDFSTPPPPPQLPHPGLPHLWVLCLACKGLPSLLPALGLGPTRTLLSLSWANLAFLLQKSFKPCAGAFCCASLLPTALLLFVLHTPDCIVPTLGQGALWWREIFPVS